MAASHALLCLAPLATAASAWMLSHGESPRDSTALSLRVSYNAAMQPLVKVAAGDQWLDLVYDPSSGDTLIFVAEYGACQPASFRPCYSYEKAREQGTVHICALNNATTCDASRGNYNCKDFLPTLDNATAHKEELVIDGLHYEQRSVEALETVSVELTDQPWAWPQGLPVRLLVEPLSVREPRANMTLRLFEGTSGLLGASGPSLSCRGDNVWSQLLARANATAFALDFAPPARARRAAAADPSANESRITLARTEREVVWSQPKQTGDYLNDAMSEFLMYHPRLCGVDLLYNISSNWLTIIDTSSPCLLLPPFLFDRIRAHAPLTCPFGEGQPSYGRLCSPKREGGSGPVLPSLRFQLEDDQEVPPRVLELPLERLTFENDSGHEFLCVSRHDEAHVGAEMVSHVSFGTLAVAALYTVVDLESGRVGLAAKGNSSTEATDAYCSARVVCKSPMQTYYPPLNVCEDPVCSKYLFMRLDGETKTCIWYRSVPALFGVLLAALVTLDLLGHRLYSQATERAAGLRPRQ